MFHVALWPMNTYRGSNNARARTNNIPVATTAATAPAVIFGFFFVGYGLMRSPTATDSGPPLTDRARDPKTNKRARSRVGSLGGHSGPVGGREVTWGATE